MIERPGAPKGHEGCTAGGRRWKPSFWLAAVAVSLAGILAVLLMTRWGIGTSPDSVAYIKAARLIAGQTSGALAGKTGAEPALIHFAPLYPAVLALGAFAGLDPMHSARWLAALLFGANIFLVWAIVRKSVRNAGWLAMAASILMVGSLPILSLHAAALSEPLFLLAAFGGFYLLARYIEEGRPFWLATGAIAIGLAQLARYSGAACILTAVAAMLLFHRGPVRARLRDAFLTGAIASLPMIVWVARNAATAGNATGRTFAFHAIGRSHLWQAFHTVSGWLLVPASAPDLVRICVWLFLAAAFLGLVSIERREGSGFMQAAGDGVSRLRLLPAMLLLFVGIYAAFLVTSISLFDANTRLDDRILSPVWVAGLVILCATADRFWPLITARRGLAGAVVVALVMFAAVQLALGVRMIAASHERGWGFSSLAWQQSRVLARVRAMPEDLLIVSNAPEVIYLHTGRSAEGLAKSWLPMERRANPRYAEQLDSLAARLARGHGIVVYLKGLTERQSEPALADLRARLPLELVADEADGIILASAPGHGAGRN